MIVIIGCPRSGTSFISALLKEHGLDVGAEVWGRDGISDWRLTLQAPHYLPVKLKPGPIPPNPPRSPFRTDLPPEVPARVEPPDLKMLKYTIVHQVRHPLKTIASLITIGPTSWEFIACHTRLTVDDPMLSRSMMAWLYLNRMAEQRVEHTYRVEEIRQEFDGICRRAGFMATLNPDFKTSTKTNTRKHNDLTWDDLEKENSALTRQIKLAATEYGYAL